MQSGPKGGGERRNLCPYATRVCPRSTGTPGATVEVPHHGGGASPGESKYPGMETDARGPPSGRATGFGDAPKPPHPSAGPQVSRAMSSGCTFRFWPSHQPNLSAGWREEGRPQLLASSPANSRSQSGFGLLYPPHVTRPEALPPPRPPRPPAPAGDELALPATGRPPPAPLGSSPPSRAGCSSSLPRQQFPRDAPLPPRLFRRLASPPPSRSSLSPRWRPCQFGASPRSGPGPRDPGCLPPR